MSKLQFEYWMELTYSEPVSECHYTVKCLPQDTDMQRISRLDIKITPNHDYQRGTDSFGNLTIYDNLYFPHSKFEVRISGTAETGLASGDKQPVDILPAMYSYSHGLNRAGERITAYYQILEQGKASSTCTPYDNALYLMQCLHRDFTYQKGVTHMQTSAEQAWQQGCGVCQDYAHILIALCHLAKIPARYVTGMMIGEGHSHAWVEVLSDGIWYGLDPTNGCTVAGDYIKIGHGRDAKDCMINKGIMKGYGLQYQNVMVRVEELSPKELL